MAAAATTPPGNTPSLPHEHCRTKHKAAVVILFIFLVISLGQETVVLKSVSRQDRFILAKTVSSGAPKLEHSERVEADVRHGTFNNMDVVYRGPNRTMYSTAECIGESFSPDSWTYRSCLYRNLCFDMESNEFVLFQSPSNGLMEQFKNSSIHFFSSSLDTSVSLGGFASNWQKGEKQRLKWSPKVLDPKVIASDGYYELIGDTVMIPYHPLAPHNIGHFIWDSLLPIYTLLSIFNLSDSKLVLLRYVLNEKPLPYSCAGKFREGCERNLRKLLPLVGVARSTFSSTEDAVLNVTTHKRQSRFVCSSHGAAGIGYLTDHGKASHGKRLTDYKGMHNHGRGPVLFGFRNYVLQSFGMDLPDQVRSIASPIRITFSLHSSGRNHRNLDFASQIVALKDRLGSKVVVESYNFSDLSMEEEIEIVAQSSILITACGGGAVSAMFLPRGASLIMFYAEQQEGVANAKLDFDYLNNMGYVRTHWLSTTNIMHSNGPSLDPFVALIQNELEVIALQ